MSYVENKEIQDEFKSTMRLFEEKHGEILEQVKSQGTEHGETRKSLDSLHNRLDEIETKMNRPKLQVPDTQDVKTEEAKVFYDWILTGDDAKIKDVHKKFNFPLMNETIDTQGGYFVPPEFANFIVDSLVQYSPIRKYATNIKMRRKEFKIPVQQRAQNLQTGAPAAGLFSTSWGSDLSTINQTNTGLIGQKTLTLCDLNALPFTTLDLGEDNMYGNTEAYMMENLIKSYAYEEGNAFVVGDGITQPTGYLTDTTGYSSVTAVGTADTIGDSGNLIWDVFYTLPDYYSRNGTWFMNRQTIRIVREWVDGQGQYLLTTNYGNTLAYDAPATIAGRPYQEVIDMPAPDPADNTYTTGSIPIVFGDMRSAYYVGDPVSGMFMLRDPYTIKGIIQLFTRTRVAGNVILPEALVKVNLAS